MRQVYILSALAYCSVAAAALLPTQWLLAARSSVHWSGWDRDYPVRPGSTWAEKLNPDGQIPQNGFKAFYFDRTVGTDKVYETTVPAIAIDYSWSDFNDIPSEHFAAYWIGRLHFGEATVQRITLAMSWAKARVFIDGELVAARDGDAAFLHEFSGGDHLIEVEFINNWHTTGFALDYDNPPPPREGQPPLEYGRTPPPGLRAAFDALPEFDRSSVSREAAEQLAAHAGADLYYIGVYESAAANRTIDVRLPDGARDAVVWLDSYETVRWRVTPEDSVAAAVIATGEREPSRSDLPPERIALSRYFGVQSADDGGCHCVAGDYHCDDKGTLNGIADTLRAITGRPIAGYATAYSPTALSPVAWTQGVSTEMARRAAARAEKARQCWALGNPDFDRMLD